MSVHVQCPTCTCPPPDKFCDASIKRGHETFDCIKREGHQPPHQAGGTLPPCPACGGCDLHAPTCPRIGGDETEGWVTAQWDDEDDEPRLVTEP